MRDLSFYTLILEPHQVTEQDPLQFYAEASDLGLPPGTWPDEIRTSLGNCRPWKRLRVETDAECEIKCAVYSQTGSGATLTIFND